MKIPQLVFLVLSLTAIPAAAKIVQIPGENFTLDVPENWTTASQAPYIYAATDPEHISVVAVAKMPNTEGHGITPSYIAGTKKGMTDSVAKIGATIDVKAENSLTIGGMPAYVFTTTESTAAGKKIDASDYVIATRDVYYLISLQTTDPAKDADLQAIASSFHFLTPPTLPDSGSDISTAERLGRFTGYGIMVLAGILTIRMIARGSRKDKPIGGQS